MQDLTDNQLELFLKGNGQELKKQFMKSGKTREKLVSLVQDDGYSFSTSGLDRMFKGELPVKDVENLLLSLAKHLGCPLTSFTEAERKTA